MMQFALIMPNIVDAAMSAAIFGANMVECLASWLSWRVLGEEFESIV
jgi:hypothetical protein